MIENKRILVTGGAGAIGSNLTARLTAARNNVVVLDDLSSGHESNLATTKCQFVRGSCDDDEVLKPLFGDEKYDYVFHLAANFANQNSVEFPQRDLRVNGLGTLKMLEHVRDNNPDAKFIFSSSSCVYGNKTGKITEDLHQVNLDTPYAVTKLLGEKYVNFFHDFYGMHTCILRYFNSFGPHEYPGRFRNVIPNFIAAALRDEPLTITGTGEESRDFNYIDNVVTATIGAAESTDTNGGIFNVCSGAETRIIDLANLINDMVGSRAGIVFKERRKWDSILQRSGDGARLRAVVGDHNQVGLKEGLTRTYIWLRTVS